jgi:hypothetical protein
MKIVRDSQESPALTVLPVCSGMYLRPEDCKAAHLNEAHVGVHHLQAVLLDERSHQVDAPVVGSHLRNKPCMITGIQARTCRTENCTAQGKPTQQRRAVLVQVPTRTS